MSDDYGLGRIPAFDPRDQAFSVNFMRSLDSGVDYRYWNPGRVLDQGSEPQCVGYSWRGFLDCAPIMSSKTGPAAPTIYARAQQLDEWPGEDYPGSSVRGGAKTLQEAGLLESYGWVTDVDAIKNFLLRSGPVVLGTLWYERMFQPDSGGYLHADGGVAGGHAYLCYGYSRPRDAFRIQNSWGPSWGPHGGRAWIDAPTLRRLVAEDGEACVAFEQRMVRIAAGRTTVS